MACPNALGHTPSHVEADDQASSHGDFVNQRRFVGQVAVVTGGADGIGKSIARRLLLEGCRVALLDLNEETNKATAEELTAELDAYTRQHGSAAGAGAATAVAVDSKPTRSVDYMCWHQVDVTSESAVVAALAAVVDSWGQLDIAINCAGILGSNGMKIADVGVQGFDLVHKINLTGSFILTKHSIPYMEKRNYGRVLLVASISGKIGNPGQAAYSSSKSGVIGLAQAVGKEYSEAGITVNSLSPTTIYTQLVANMHPKQVQYNMERIPMKRCGTVEEAAAMACFIVSPDASFNTGFNFDLSGGRAPF